MSPRVRAVFEDEDGGEWVERPPSLFVYSNYEAVTDEEGVQTPIMLCLEDDKSDHSKTFYREDCIAVMFDHLNHLTLDEGDDSRLIIVFRNFEGSDGMFLLQYLYPSRDKTPNQCGYQDTVTHIGPA